MTTPDPLTQFKDKLEEPDVFMFFMTPPEKVAVTVTFDFVPLEWSEANVND